MRISHATGTTRHQDRLGEISARTAELREREASLRDDEQALRDQVDEQAQAAVTRKATSEEAARQRSRMGKLAWAGLAVALASVVAVPVLTPLAGVLTVGSLVGAAFAMRRHEFLDHEAHVLGFSADNQRLLSQLNGAQADAMRGLRTEVQEQIRALEGERQTLEVESLAAGGGPAGTIDATEDTVTIGGIALPRRG